MSEKYPYVPSTALEKIFNAPKTSISPLFSFIRAEYLRNPTAFSIDQVPHLSLDDPSSHITLKQRHPFIMTGKPGTMPRICDAFTLYHIKTETYVNPVGMIKTAYVEMTTIDADKKPFVLCRYKKKC